MANSSTAVREFFGGRLSLKGLLDTAMWLCLAGSLATLFDFLGWPWELPAHFRGQGAMALTACVLIHALSRSWKRLAVFAICATVLWATIFRSAPPGVRSGSSAGNVFRVCSFNVHTENKDFQSTLDFLRTNKFDAVFLMEIDGRWLRAIKSLAAEYPFLTAEPREDNFGIAFLSREKPAKAEIIWPGQAEVPSIEVELDGLRLVGTHPVPPATAENADYRNGQLEAVARVVVGKMHTLLVGDLNCTPWTAPFKRLEAQSGLRSISSGFLRQPTWPAFDPAWLRIPIDHALISPDIAVQSFSVGPDVGSDHRPLILEILLGNP